MTAFTIHKLDATTSTNEVLKKAVTENKLQKPTAIWAEYQTQGKGQHAHRWESQMGKNLTFSVFWPDLTSDPLDAFQINRAVCLALIDVFQKLEIPQIAIKWPNDILSANSKLAGILIENSLQGQRSNLSIVGIGINVNQTDFSHLPKASSLALTLGKSLDREQLFTDLLTALEKAFISLDSVSVDLQNKAYEKYLFGHNEWHSFVLEGEDRRGKIRSVTTKGALQIEWESGELQDFKDSKALALLY